MSDADNWRRADALFDRLLDLPRAQWNALIAEQPQAIRALLHRLVAAHESSGPLDSAMTASPLSSAVPDTIGSWRRGEEIGRGGMSVVYRAERRLGDATQTAALKLLTVSALAADGRQLQREHQALARLQHPGIVPLLDAGVLEDGTPYLAMPLVEGERIDRWCAQQALSVNGIVTLFRQVCDAVAYAHRRLVIHRDLKPGNILVDAEGRVHLLDFGIARLLDGGIDAEATATRFRSLTPQYAAPEQFGGVDSGTAVDVFGLGAVLYQLLTGRPPRLSASERHDTLTLPSRAALRNDALSPGRRRGRSKALHGDLDAILVKALEDDPERRYPDAAALADDLRRWRQRRPVSAIRAGAFYRFSKFGQRHRGMLVAAGLLLLAILGGLAGTLWQAREAARQAQQARTEAQRSQKTRDFVIDLFDAANPESQGNAVTEVADLLSRATDELQADSTLPEDLRADFEGVLGAIVARTGNLDEGRRLLTRARQRYQSLPGHFKSEQELRLLQMDIENRAGNYEESERQAAAVLLALGNIGENHPKLRSSALSGRANARSYLDPGSEEASQWMQESLALAESLDPPDALTVARRLLNFGLIARRTGQTADAERYLRRAEATVAEADAVPFSFRLVLDQELAIVLMSVGKPGEARQAADRALSLSEKMYSTDHYRYAQALDVHGLQLFQMGELEAAESELSRAVAIMRAQPGLPTARLANPLFNLALVQDDLGHYQAAAANLAEVQAMDEAELGELHEYVLLGLTKRGELLAAVGDPQAQALFEDAGSRLVRLPADRPWSVYLQTAVVRYADHLQQQGRVDEALDWVERAIDQHHRRGEPADPNLSHAETVRMLATAQLGSDEELDAAERRALRVAEDCPDERIKGLSRFYLKAAALRLARGEASRASTLFQRFEERRGELPIAPRWQALHRSISQSLRATASPVQ
ncbi:MAG: serine/threonine-protein kinase [Lysobacteraceae bacterium]